MSARADGRARRRALRAAVVATRPRWRLLARSTLLGTAAMVAAASLLAVSGYLISRASQHPDVLALGVAIAAVRGLAIARALLRYLERLASHDLAFRTLADIRVRFFRAIVPLVPAGLPAGTRRGDLLSRLVSDVDRLQDLYLRALGPPLVAVAAGAAAVTIATVMLPAAGVVLAIALAATGTAVPFAARQAARSAGRRQATARAELGSDLLEIVEGAPEIALMGRTGDWEERARLSSGRLTRLQRRDALAGGVAAGLGAFACSAGVLAVLAVSAQAVHSGALAGVLLAAVTLLALGAFEAVTPLAAAAARIDACADAALRVGEAERTEPPVRDPERPRPCPEGGALALERVRFGYGPGLPPVLDGASLRLEPGAAVALTGSSGAGKSTVAELLVRFRDPERGRATLGGADLRSLSQAELRAAVRLVPQDAYLFATTLRANVALGRPEASDGEVVAALRRVGLGDWLERLPEGLATELGERGERVSGGQRQRIAAARGLLAGGRFLVFDEPTAHLDPRAARELLAELAACARESGSAVLVITHEREGLEPFDAVLELRDGAVRVRTSPVPARGRLPMPRAGGRSSVPA